MPTEIQGSRFTCWLSDTERSALEKLAREHNCSLNYIVRTAIREYLQQHSLETEADLGA